VGEAGQFLERSIVDTSVGTPEHLCFEGPPPLEPELAQDQTARMPQVVNGDWADTRAAQTALTVIEESRWSELKAKAKLALKPESARKRAAWVARQIAKLMARGMTEQAARTIVTKHADGVLTPAVELTFANPAIGTVTVGDVLADPDKYVDEALADP